MATSAKAHMIAAELLDRLKRRPSIKDLAMVSAVDVDANPYLAIGAGSPGGRNAIVKVRPVDWSLAKDVLGLAQAIYTPHVIQVVAEANPAGGAGADVLSAGDLLDLLAQCGAMGCIVELYNSANGDSPDLDDITPAKLKGTYHPDDMRPLISAQ